VVAPAGASDEEGKDDDEELEREAVREAAIEEEKEREAARKEQRKQAVRRKREEARRRKEAQRDSARKKHNPWLPPNEGGDDHLEQEGVNVNGMQGFYKGFPMPWLDNSQWDHTHNLPLGDVVSADERTARDKGRQKLQAAGVLVDGMPLEEVRVF
jgi:hypothetical protein